MNKSNGKLNCAVIGLGRLGYRNATNIMKNTRAKLVAIAEPMREARERAIHDFGCETHEDYKDLLKDSTIDVVVHRTNETTL